MDFGALYRVLPDIAKEMVADNLPPYGSSDFQNASESCRDIRAILVENVTDQLPTLVINVTPQKYPQPAATSYFATFGLAVKSLVIHSGVHDLDMLGRAGGATQLAPLRRLRKLVLLEWRESFALDISARARLVPELEEINIHLGGQDPYPGPRISRIVDAVAAASPWWPHLHKITFSAIRFAPNDAVRLAQVLQQSPMEYVQIFGNIGAVGVSALATSASMHWPNMKFWDLAFNYMGDEGAAALAASAANCPNIIHLGLGNNGIGPSGMTLLADAAGGHWPRIEEWSVGNNRIGDAGATALARSFDVCVLLRRVNVSRNSIGEAGIRELIQRRPQLCELDVSHNFQV